MHYGIYSSEMPDSWGTYVETDTTYFEFPPLEPGKTYTVEVSALCGDDNYGDIMSINFTTRSNAGMDNPQNPSMPTIYPNPANGQCTVAFPDNQPTEITLYSSDGRTIQSVTTDGAPVVLHLPQAGIYILHTTSDTGTATCKIISR
ncbi:MAG: T9SS type A sorting domain-containing protein [Bacteroidales bacterium]|nr:T9SS type A sorting domain-containing protein [Bacteroidales bacterium]